MGFKKRPTESEAKMITSSPTASENKRLRAALEDIAGRWPDDDAHSREHGEKCDVVVCVAKRALKKAGRHG